MGVFAVGPILDINHGLSRVQPQQTGRVLGGVGKHQRDSTIEGLVGAVRSDVILKDIEVVKAVGFIPSSTSPLAVRKREGGGTLGEAVDVLEARPGDIHTNRGRALWPRVPVSAEGLLPQTIIVARNVLEGTGSALVLVGLPLHQIPGIQGDNGHPLEGDDRFEGLGGEVDGDGAVSRGDGGNAVLNGERGLGGEGLGRRVSHKDILHFVPLVERPFLIDVKPDHPVGQGRHRQAQRPVFVHLVGELSDKGGAALAVLQRVEVVGGF
mmetsp:Transcript_45485/g.114050  ORF Transcript_45485/g.114050 Transcript_45485/m.114050 type:complete len:267 (+) Transcript_45485:1885-2685(+)